MHNSLNLPPLKAKQLDNSRLAGGDFIDFMVEYLKEHNQMVVDVKSMLDKEGANGIFEKTLYASGWNDAIRNVVRLLTQ